MVPPENGSEINPFVISDDDDDEGDKVARQRPPPRNKGKGRAVPDQPVTLTSDSDDTSVSLDEALRRHEHKKANNRPGPSRLAQTPIKASPSTPRSKRHQPPNTNGTTVVDSSDDDGPVTTRNTRSPLARKTRQSGFGNYFTPNAAAGPSRGTGAGKAQEDVVPVDDAADNDGQRRPSRRAGGSSPTRRPTRARMYRGDERPPSSPGFQTDNRRGGWSNPEPMQVRKRTPPPKISSSQARASPAKSVSGAPSPSRAPPPPTSSSGAARGSWGNPEPLIIKHPRKRLPSPGSREDSGTDTPAKRLRVSTRARKSTGGRAPRGAQLARSVPAAAPAALSPVADADTAALEAATTTPPLPASPPAPTTPRTRPGWATDNASPGPSRENGRRTPPQPAKAALKAAAPVTNAAPVPASSQATTATATPGVTTPAPPHRAQEPLFDHAPSEASSDTDFFDAAHDFAVDRVLPDSLFEPPLPPSSFPTANGEAAPVAPDATDGAVEGNDLNDPLLLEILHDLGGDDSPPGDTAAAPGAEAVAATDDVLEPIGEMFQSEPQLEGEPAAEPAAEKTMTPTEVVMPEGSPEETPEPIEVVDNDEPMAVDLREPTPPAPSVDRKGKKPMRVVEAAARTQRPSQSQSSRAEFLAPPAPQKLGEPIPLAEGDTLQRAPRVSRREWERMFYAAERATDTTTLFQGKDSMDPAEVPAPEMRGSANRVLNTRMIDRYHRWIKNHPPANPDLLCSIFESYMSQATSIDEPYAPQISVRNNLRHDHGPPDFEFHYSNEMLYTDHVPDPELGHGCDCEGPCDPNSKTCLCVKRQQLYFYNIAGLDGFQYREDGTLKQNDCPIWECGPNCGCPPECMNRVIQRGRSANTQIQLFKTPNKGWGVRAINAIPMGTFIGIYSGELITEAESETRGQVYDRVGRTYLFDLDGYHISHPPAGLEEIDPRAHQLAMIVKARADAAAAKERDEALEQGLSVEEGGVLDDGVNYSAYSVDAFHYGFTRYINHSCDPNLVTAQAYVNDVHPERPLLVIFARRDIRPFEELCISYKGVPDDSVPEPASDPRARGRPRKSKTSVTAHVSPKVSARTEECKCGAWNCDGLMFGGL